MRVMILGAGGMLGHDLLATKPADISTFPFTRRALDITDTASVAAAVAEVRPDVIINAAAYTAVDRAESERDLAFRVNAEAVGELGRIARDARVRVVHFSTDYVFDGTSTEPYTEDSPTNPMNVYGASKLAGEDALREGQSEFLIIRTQWLFGMHGKSFPKTMWERARAGAATKVVNDQIGRLTATHDLARVTWALIDNRASGILHAANQGEATWYHVAVHVFSSMGRDDLVSPCASSDYPTSAPRPRYSVLSTRRLERFLKAPMSPYRTALDDFLRRLQQ